MDISSLLERADLLIEQGRYQDAEKYIQQALEIDPQNDYVLSVLARCYLNNGQYDEGIEVTQRALTINPEESFYFYLRGFGFHQKDLHLPAIESLNKAIELNPYNAEYFGLLGSIFLDEKQYEVALGKANEGLKLDADNITCLNVRARALNRLKRVGEAEQTIEDSLAKDPDNAYTHITVGWNYLERGDHRSAKQHFREALRIDPDNVSGRVGLKESLKSIFLPYKLLFQFSLWISEKSKNFRLFFYIGIYVLVRLFNSISKSNPELQPLITSLVVLYFLFIFFGWIANPIADFFLLFHKDGKYSVERSEKAKAISVVSLLITGICILWYSYSGFENPPDSILIPSYIIISFSIPVSQINFPPALRKLLSDEWMPYSLLLAGILAILFFVVYPEAGYLFTAIYGLGLLVYTWVANTD